MTHHGSSRLTPTGQGPAAFFAYVRRRRQQMLAAGVLTAVVGSVIAASLRGGAAIWGGGLALVGLALAAGAAAGSGQLRRARRLANGPAQRLELATWPYRTVKSLTNNRVLVTLDAPGSTARAPLAEFTAAWATPGAAERPPRQASVFGSLARGETVLAVADDGSCFVGRVSRNRPVGAP